MKLNFEKYICLFQQKVTSLHAFSPQTDRLGGRRTKKQMKKTNITLLLLLVVALPLRAENGINSPYSQYGIGQLAGSTSGFSRAMGGTGIALRNENQINLLNPASYTSVDTLTFIMDLGLSLQNVNFAENGVRKNARNTTFDYIAMQYRLCKGLGMTLAFVPQSNAGYDYKTTETIRKDEDGTITATNEYNGTGGLRDVMAGIGWNPFGGLSIGANARYTYGEISRYVENTYSDETIDARTKTYYSLPRNLSADFGFQYQFKAGKEVVTLGATYGMGWQLNDESYIIDYRSNSTALLSTDTVWCAGAFAPAPRWAAGISWKHDERLTLAADFGMTQWSAVSFFNDHGCDSWHASVGAEYIPKLYSRHFFDRLKYRAGLFASSPYYNINGAAGPMEYGATVGVGIPVINSWNNRPNINVSGQVVHVTGPIVENCLRLCVSIDFTESWFTKWRVN